MLYKDFINQDLECEDCPLYSDMCRGGMTSNHNGEPVEPPCCNFDDDTDMEEWASIQHKRILDMEERETERHKRQLEKEARKEVANERRRASMWHVHEETRELKRLRKQIEAIESAHRLKEAFNSASNMINNISREIDDRQKNEEISNIENKIKELELRKKQKLKEFRENYLQEENK